MKKQNKSFYICGACQKKHPKWQGQCDECHAWHTLEEIVTTKNQAIKETSLQDAIPLTEISFSEEQRIVTRQDELDRILGGGLVKGSIVLLGGEPGIGKSTLLLQAAAGLSHANKILYVSGEESREQVAMRAKRLSAQSENIFLLSEVSLERIVEQTKKIKPDILIIDSIQTIGSQNIDSQAGSATQIRECTHEITQFCKPQNISVFLVGHVNKDGNLAGPKLLEHMVDVVLSFEGSQNQNLRMLRSQKNRFGSTQELAVFEMSEVGMAAVTNPSELFITERDESVPGTLATACIEGTRPLLVEIQALVSQTTLAIPRRTAIGLDHNRVSLLSAIIEKRMGVRLYNQDIYMNLVGGIRITEPATDMAVMLSILSSFFNKPLDPHMLSFGEVGLGGELRSVPKTQERINEATKLGFKTLLIPKSKNSKKLQLPEGLKLIELSHVNQMKDFL